MNTDACYERQPDRTIFHPLPTPDASPESLALVVHRDPSQPMPGASIDVDRSRPSVTWVRPSELPTLVGAPWVRRGIDLQAELTRRTRRAPASATARAGRRISQTAIARAEPATPTVRTAEGPEL